MNEDVNFLLKMVDFPMSFVSLPGVSSHLFRLKQLKPWVLATDSNANGKNGPWHPNIFGSKWRFMNSLNISGIPKMEESSRI